MPANNATETHHLVLIGGGHSHLFVIEHFARQPVSGVTVTVVSKEAYAPYSGMIPGVIAGHYHADDAHVDLAALCRRSSISFVHAEVIGLDTTVQSLRCANGQTLNYDVLSIDIGSSPALDAIPGATTAGYAVKPIPQLLSRWHQLNQRLKTSLESQDGTQQQITVIGGGAASIEVALAMHYQLAQQLGDGAKRIQWRLISSSSQLLPTHNRWVRRKVNRTLSRCGFSIVCNRTVRGIQRDAQRLVLDMSNEEILRSDEVIWATHAGAQAWLAQAGLTCTDNGFVRVNAYLQSVSHSNIFAAGDIAHFEPQPLPKSGVYAVRQGPPLAHNLDRFLRGQCLKAFKPQRRTLSLLSLGERRAIASWGLISLQGRWVWRWKNTIDRRFMQRFKP